MIPVGIRRVGPSLRETVAALADELAGDLQADQLVGGVIVGIVVLTGRGINRRASWRWHVATREGLLATKAQLAADGGRTLAQIGREAADA
jgi:hypothetical protein